MHVSAAEPPQIRPDVIWSHALKKSKKLGRGLYQFSQPVLADDHLYIGSATGAVVALTTDGKETWIAPTTGPVYAAVQVTADQVFAADSKGSVYALVRGNGAQLWQTNLGNEVMASPLVVDHTVYVVTTNGQLYALDRSTGIPRWHTAERLTIAEFSVRGTADPILHQGQIVVGHADGRLTAYSPANGDILWEERIARRGAALHDVDATALALGNQLVTASVGNGLAAVDGKSGRLRWFEPLASPNAVTAEGNTLFVAGNGTISAVDARNGRVQWHQTLPGVSESSSAAVMGTHLVVFSTKGPMFLLDRSSGTIVGRRDVGRGTYGHPLVAGDRIYVVTNGHRVLALRIP